MNKMTRVLIISLFTNILLSIGKIVFGIFGNSSALIADGIHSFSDFATDIVSMLGGFLSRKPADKKHPFGHGKIEYLTSLIIGFVVLSLGFTLLYNSFKFEVIIPNALMIIVSLFTIIAKYILADYIFKKGKQYNNNILIASGIESKTDVYSSVVVLVSIALMQLANINVIFGYANLLATILISILIIKTGYSIFKENISILLEEQIVDKEYINKIKAIILEFTEVKEIKKFYILRYGPYYKLLSDITMEKEITLLDAHEIIDLIETKIKKEDERIKYVFIHMEPEV